MKLSIHDLIKTSEVGRISPAVIEQQELIRICRSVYAPMRMFDLHRKEWTIRSQATLVRAAAVAAARAVDAQIVFTSEIALKLYGIDTWTNTADIVYRRIDGSSYTSTYDLPPLRIGTADVPSVKVFQLRSRSLTDEVMEAATLNVVPAWVAAVDCSRHSHPLIGIAAVSSYLNAATGFIRGNPDPARTKADDLKNRMLKRLESLAGCPGTRRAHAVITASDPGIETPGEACLLWLIHCLLTHSPRDRDDLVTQYAVEIEGRHYYADSALPGRRILFEFDGTGKISGNENAFLDRQTDLLTDGWNVVRVSIKELMNPQALIERLTRLLRQLGVPASVPSGVLWSPLTPEVLDVKRRH